MESVYQIFRIAADGTRTLCDDAPTYALAEVMAQKHGRVKPGRYAIVDKRTGQITVMNLETPMDVSERLPY